jgi:hypothetical protein
MKNITRGTIDIELDSFRLISLFMKDFFRKEGLERNPPLKRLLEGLDKVQVSDWGVWADFTRRSILSVAIPSICSTLERPLNEFELLYLSEYTEEFIESYEVNRFQSF